MPRKSKAVLTKEEVEKLTKQFVHFITNLSPSQFESFFHEFMTYEEKIMLAKRLSLYTLLYSGYPLMHIQQSLGISHETTRIYNTQKDTKSDMFKKLINSLVEKNKNLEILKKIEKKLKPLEFALNAKSNMKARAKLMQADFEDHP